MTEDLSFLKNWGLYEADTNKNDIFSRTFNVHARHVYNRSRKFL